MIGQTLVQLPKVNIYTYPKEIIHPAHEGMQLSIGDLHANAMKFIYFLTLHGILQLTAPQFNKLKNSYYTTKLTKKQLSDFVAILDQAIINPEAGAALIRLIGDELSDRGLCDYLILKIIQKLRKMGVNLEVLLSNHGFEFVKAYELNAPFNATMLNAGLAASMINMQTLIDEKLIDRAEIEEIVAQCYKPSLKLISCSLNHDENEITIYSHAPIGIDNIEHLAKQFGVEYKDDTTIELAQTIENINQIFSQHVEANTVHTLCDPYWMNEGYCGRKIDPNLAPVPYAIWNRDCELNRPHEYKNYRINYVHGHDAKTKTNNYIFNLDNTLGIDIIQATGSYSVLSSQDHPFALSPHCTITKDASLLDKLAI